MEAEQRENSSGWLFATVKGMVVPPKEKNKDNARDNRQTNTTFASVRSCSEKIHHIRRGGYAYVPYGKLLNVRGQNITKDIHGDDACFDPFVSLPPPPCPFPSLPSLS